MLLVVRHLLDFVVIPLAKSSIQEFTHYKRGSLAHRKSHAVYATCSLLACRQVTVIVNLLFCLAVVKFFIRLPVHDNN